MGLADRRLINRQRWWFLHRCTGHWRRLVSWWEVQPRPMWPTKAKTELVHWIIESSILSVSSSNKENIIVC